MINTRLKEETRKKDYFGDETAIVRTYATKQRVSEFAYFAYFIEIASSLKNIKFERVRILNESYRVGSDGHMYFSDEEVNDKQLATSKYWRFKQNALNELAGFWCDGTMNGKEIAIEILPKKQEVIITTPEQNPANISLLEAEMSIEGMFE